LADFFVHGPDVERPRRIRNRALLRFQRDGTALASTIRHRLHLPPPMSGHGQETGAGMVRSFEAFLGESSVGGVCAGIGSDQQSRFLCHLRLLYFIRSSFCPPESLVRWSHPLVIHSTSLW